MMRCFVRQPAFTLAELLIALAILGVIATFTIPKVLDSGSSSQNISIVKESVGMVSGAYQTYKLQQTASASTSFEDFLPYINYVKIETAVSFDDVAGADVPCAVGLTVCLRLHNGGILWYRNNEAFGGTEQTNAFRFSIDADGATSDIYSIQFLLYYNGRVTTLGQVLPNTYSSTDLFNPNPPIDQAWFTWGN